MAFMIKDKDTILQEALKKLTTTTAISSTSPGSIARALTEAITTQLGNFYSILDFNMSLSVLSTAQGQALDMIGALYNITRKTLSDTAAIDKALGSFYFYVDSPFTRDLLIPAGTKVYTNTTGAVGQQFSYATTEDAVILVGRTRVYASIRPLFVESVFTAGQGTLTVIDPSLVQPIGTTIKATNPKPIQAQLGQEDDISYRTRISLGAREAAGGTIDAVRLAGLSVNGVRDISIRDTPYGLGSFEALVVSEDNLINGPVLVAATTAMNQVRPVGVRMFIRQPDLLPLDVYASIIIRSDVNVDTGNIVRRTQVGILRYLNTMLVGTPLVYNQLIQAILDATDVVTDVTITRLASNGTEILRKNYTPDSDQQIIPGDIKVSLSS